MRFIFKLAFHLSLLFGLLLTHSVNVLAQSSFNFSSLPASYKVALANSLETTLKATQGLFALKSASLINSQGNDCTQFSSDGVCTQIGARYTELASPKISSKSIILNTAYKFSDNVHVGGYIDAGNITSQPSFSHVNQRGSDPILGIYSVFNDKIGDHPFFLRLGANVGTTSLELTTPNITNAGTLSRNLKIKGQSYMALLSTPLLAQEKKLILAPYLGTSYTSLKVDGDSGNSSGLLSNIPIIFNGVSVDLFALQVGLNSIYRPSESLSFSASGGIQHTLTSNMSNLAVSQSALFSSYSGKVNLARDVPVFTATAKYIPYPNQELVAKFSYRQEVYERIAATSYMLFYSIGF